MKRPAPSRARLTRIVSEAALVVAGALVCLWLTGYLAMDLHAPANMAGDHLFVVTMAKSYIDGHGFRLNPNLGFPEVQDYLYFPTFDFTQRSLLWLSAQVTQRPFLAVHGYYIGGIAAMFAATLWALRWLGARWWFAAIAAVGYVVSPYMVGRAFGHDFLALFYAAPFGLALALKIATSPPPESLKAFLLQPFVVAAILVAGGSGVYYGFFSLMFIAFCAVAAAISQQRLKPLWTGLAVCALMFAVVMISGFGLDLITAFSGKYPTPRRAPVEELMYGLDLPSMIYPLNLTKHTHEAVAQAQSMQPWAFTSEGVGEFPGFLLTVVLILSPLIAASAPFALRRDRVDGLGDARVRLIGLAALLATFGMLYAERGGLGFIFNTFVSPQIRATARIIPFLSFCVLVVVVFGAELAMASRRSVVRYGIPAILAVGLLVSITPIYGYMAQSQLRHYRETAQIAGRASTPPMLQAKDRIAAQRVLELPVMYWPESPVSSPTVDPYAAQLPYIYDRKRSTTRWSYGATALQGNFFLRQFVLSKPEGLPGRARAYGYDSLLVMKQAYEKEAPAIVASLDAQLGYACRAYDDAVYTLYTLKTGRDGRPCGGAQ